ncbi:coiled-coil domain-containing protein 30-like [Cyprinus carpio]|uniref:Coiled-coil domain-containing protein 30-like n=1 Tax=Cyprinus carpio TaxID=7962 RepID=A0A9R0AJN9_CYPCA|nr:coiled-coil domain-containing protein 30-like [Cyprinus carpio]
MMKKERHELEQAKKDFERNIKEFMKENSRNEEKLLQLTQDKEELSNNLDKKNKEIESITEAFVIKLGQLEETIGSLKEEKENIENELLQQKQNEQETLKIKRKTDDTSIGSDTHAENVTYKTALEQLQDTKEEKKTDRDSSLELTGIYWAKTDEETKAKTYKTDTQREVLQLMDGTTLERDELNIMTAELQRQHDEKENKMKIIQTGLLEMEKAKDHLHKLRDECKTAEEEKSVIMESLERRRNSLEKVQAEVLRLTKETEHLTQSYECKRRELQQIETDIQRQTRTEETQQETNIQSEQEDQEVIATTKSIQEHTEDVEQMRTQETQTEDQERDTLPQYVEIDAMKRRIQEMKDELKNRLQDIQRKELEKLGMQREKIELELRKAEIERYNEALKHERETDRLMLIEKEKEILLLRECMLIEINRLKSEETETSSQHLEIMERLISDAALRVDRFRRVTDRAVQTLMLEGDGEKIGGAQRVTTEQMESVSGRVETSLDVLSEDREEGARGESQRGGVAGPTSRRLRLLHWFRRCCCCCCPRNPRYTVEDTDDIL